jgi:hypothetical protein
MPNPLHPHYVEMKSLLAQGWTLQAVGDRFGLTRERVRQIAGNVGNRYKERFEANVPGILAAWESGLPLQEIAAKFKISKKRFSRMGLPRRVKPLAHGTLNGYRYHKCHCELCREANNRRCREGKHRRRKHGLCVQCGAESATWRCAKCCKKNAA